MLPYFSFTTIYLGPIPIQVWGLFVSLGMILALAILWRRGGVDRERLLDLALFMMIGGILVARVFHVVLYEPSFYASHPAEIMALWHGGLSSFGGIVGAVLGFGLYVRRQKNFFEEYSTAARRRLYLVWSDMVSFAALYGWMVGRIGCFMIHDHLGVHSTCPWALATPTGPRLEMALMEIAGLVPLAIVFFVMRKKRLPAGWFLAVLSLYYGLLRFILDFYRATDIPVPDVRYFGLTPAQYFAIVLVFFSAFGLRKIVRKHGEVA